MRRLSAILAILGLVSVTAATLPSAALATDANSIWWRHSAAWTDCVAGAQAALAVSGFTGIGVGDSSHVYGHAGEYVASIRCIDQTVILTVAGPQQSVADSLTNRIRDSWR